MGALDPADIQGLILRGYRFPIVRHFVFQVIDPAQARLAFGRLVGSPAAELQVTSSRDWGEVKPDYCLNVGLTWSGLVALELEQLPDFSFESFVALTQGAAKRASIIGDIGKSDPATWIGGLGSGHDHVIFALYASSDASLEAFSASLRNNLQIGTAFRETLTLEGRALQGQKVHFGYRDGISQPTIEGGPEKNIPDDQPVSAAWNFIITDSLNSSYYVPKPVVLGLNGSFAAFRILRQDVVGFDNFLQSQKSKIDPELLAAKVCGRWRNGVPLTLSPATDRPAPPIPEEDLNGFDYVLSASGTGSTDDSRGIRCPLGSHIRRANPRSGAVMGGGNHLHRIIRRGMPYGAPYQPGQPDDGIDRGLVGFFICSSLENQFEFIMSQWINGGGFAPGLDQNSLDIFSGTNDPSRSIFQVSTADPTQSLEIKGFSSFVTTRGSAYCFLPSLTALAFISRFSP